MSTPTSTSRPTSGSRTLPASRRLHPIMVSGQTRRSCGSSAIYSSHTNAGTKNTSAGPLLSTWRSPVSSALLDRARCEKAEAQPRRAASIAAAQTQIAQCQQRGDHQDGRHHECADAGDRCALPTCCPAPCLHSGAASTERRSQSTRASPAPPPLRSEWAHRDDRDRCPPMQPARQRRSAGSTEVCAGENRAIERPASAKSGFQVAAGAADAPASLRRLDLCRDGQEADEPACSIERHATRIPERVSGGFSASDDVGAANRHQPPRTLAVPEQERRRLRRGERAPSRRRIGRCSSMYCR